MTDVKTSTVETAANTDSTTNTAASTANTTNTTNTTNKVIGAVAAVAAARIAVKVARGLIAIGIMFALVVVCALVALTTQAYANDGMSWEESEVRAQAANAGLDPDAAAASWAEGAAADSVHYEGEPVTISPGNGGKDVYAEWHMVDGEWVATFVTYNGNEVVARPEANEIGWTFWVSDNGTSVQVVRTAEEGAGANTESHWQEVHGVKRY